jgi:hypothetical protein
MARLGLVQPIRTHGAATEAVATRSPADGPGWTGLPLPVRADEPSLEGVAGNRGKDRTPSPFLVRTSAFITFPLSASEERGRPRQNGQGSDLAMAG